MKHLIIRYPSDLPENHGFLLNKCEMQPGQSCRVHWHDYLEFEIVVSGRIRHNHNNSQSIITRGCSHLMCYNDFHSMTALTHALIYSVHFKKEFIHPDLARHLEYKEFHCKFTADETDEIIELLLKTDAELASDDPFSTLLVKNRMEDILIRFLRKTTVNPSHTMMPPVQQVVTYIHNNYRSSMTIEQLAKQFSLSPNYLGHIFKSEIGTTFHEYLNTLRLKFACNLLSSTELTVKEIAFSSGYHSLEYFMHVFKKKLNMTPLQYRSRQNASPE